MSNGAPTPDELKAAPLAFQAWPHLRVSLAHGLRDYPQQALKLASGIRLGK